MGNCYHQQFQFSVENIDNFNDFDETIDISNDFEETIENFNGFEETIENFQWFWRTPSPLNVFWYADHWQRWFFNGFGVVQPLVSMVFDGQGPLVKRWNGFNGSNRSTAARRSCSSLQLYLFTMDRLICYYICALIDNCILNPLSPMQLKYFVHYTDWL